MVYRKLKSLRAMHGIKQDEMAEIIGMGKTSYSLKENGRRDFSLKEAKAISDYFGQTVDEIFFTPTVPELKTLER